MNNSEQRETRRAQRRDDDEGVDGGKGAAPMAKVGLQDGGSQSVATPSVGKASKRGEDMEEEEEASCKRSGTEEEPMESMSIREITEEIGSLYERMRKGLRGSQTNRSMDAFEDANNRMDKLVRMRNQHYKMLDAKAKAMDSRASQINGIVEDRGMSTAVAKRFTSKVDSEEYRNAFSTYLLKGDRTPASELRVMVEGTPADGGYLPATEFYTTLIQKRFQFNAMRGCATSIPLGTFKTEMTLESTFGTAEYLGEGSGATESHPTFTNLTFTPYTLRYFTKVSNELIADAATRGSGFAIDTILANQIGRVVGLKEEVAFTTGAGASGSPAGPRGIYTYTTSGIATRTTAASGTISATDLQALTYDLGRAYRPSAKWVMTDAVAALIRRILQTSPLAGTAASGYAGGNYAPYAWSMGDGKLQDGEPDRLFGYPVVTVAAGPTVQANAIVAVFGDFEFYKIGEREGLSIQTAREQFLVNNQTGYFAFARHDAQATLLEAFRYLKLQA